jgi:ATP-dependent helicase/nuclease subunit A
MRSPNTEQKCAIECHGGVLSAGAGSGKTFVLIEHTFNKLIRFAEQLHSENPMNWLDDFYIKASKIALLTFTKKAAAEMKERLSARIEAGESPVFLTKEIMQESINGIFVGTIHAFLLKIIKEGGIEGIEKAEISSPKKFEREINEYVERSVIELRERIDQNSYHCLLANLDQVKISFFQIFNDAELRSSWENFDIEKVENNFWKSFYQLNEISGVIEDLISLDDFDKDKEKIWHQAISEYKGMRKGFEGQSFEEHLVLLANFFDKFKRITPPRKPEYVHVINFIKYFKILRTSFKASRDHLELCVSKREEMKKFYSVLKDLFYLIDSKVKFENNITFSSIEYIFNKTEFVSPPLKYLLVDEFQDTSWTQHRIVEKLVVGGWENVFCVGDKKQAIYRFRGGEIDVFDKTISLAKNNLQLKSNYRSDVPIVTFNNGFFSKLFPLGNGFSNIKEVKVKMEEQQARKESDNNLSMVALLKTLCDQSNGKITNHDIDMLESEIIFQKIEELNDNDSVEVAILYSRLSPSYFLIKKLLRSNYSFVSQVKIINSEQPVVAALMIVIENALGFFPSEMIAQRKIDKVFSVLGAKSNYQTSSSRILENTAYFGCKFALMKEMSLFEITITDKENTVNYISSICDSSKGSLENVWMYLKGFLKDKFSIELRSKKDSQMKIQIMSVHSSKGLEFKNVILGGIHTNGGVIKNDGLVKKWPGSFKWMPNVETKKLAQSPNYILESLEDKILDFNEQKRLLYVACTRAESSLFFPFIIDNESGEPIGANKNSWVKAISLYQEDVKEINFSTDINTSLKSRRLPLFHVDNFGITKRNKTFDNLNISVDHSVTGLSDLYFCPRKYYLSNVCKFDDNMMNFIIKVYDDFLPTQFKKFIPLHPSEDSKSNKERGSLIHRYIESYIKNDKQQKVINSNEEGALIYCFDLLKNISPKYELLSEYSMKFKLNGQFVNGICDLVLLDKVGDHSEIWDFKTGSLDIANADKYKNQLFLYGIGIFDLFPRITELTLKLIYLDEQKIVDYKFKRDQADAITKDVAAKMASPWDKVESNCQQCEYQKVCQVKLINC